MFNFTIPDINDVIEADYLRRLFFGTRFMSEQSTERMRRSQALTENRQLSCTLRYEYSKAGEKR